jgi:hypothetical protein
MSAHLNDGPVEIPAWKSCQGCRHLVTLHADMPVRLRGCAALLSDITMEIMIMNEPFALEPSPPDPQVVRVYRLDDCTWWAGYSLQQCIDDARRECGNDCYEDSEREGYKLSAEQMQRLSFLDDVDCPACEKRTFAAELQRRIDAGEQFPQFFASTEG